MAEFWGFHRSMDFRIGTLSFVAVITGQTKVSWRQNVFVQQQQNWVVDERDLRKDSTLRLRPCKPWPQKQGISDAAVSNTPLPTSQPFRTACTWITIFTEACGTYWMTTNTTKNISFPSQPFGRFFLKIRRTHVSCSVLAQHQCLRQWTVGA